jgi:hypothetical protein
MGDLEFNNLGAELPAPGSIADASLITAAREFCVTWERAVKTICMYPATNALPNEFRQKFFDALIRLLEEYGHVAFDVTDTDLRVDNSPVSHHATTEDNLAYFLFRDGICRVTFTEGLEFEESSAFLNALAEEYSASGHKMNVANRLWQEALPHIRHYTLDRVIEGNYIDAADDEQITERHRKFSDSGSLILPDGDGSDSAPTPPPKPYCGIQQERFEYVTKVFGDISGLTPEEQSGLAVLARTDTDESNRQLGLEILFEILQTVENPRLVEETIAVTEKQFQRAVHGNAWSTVKAILENWRAVQPMTPSSVSKQIRDAQMRATDAQYFESLAQYLNANPQCDLSETRGVLENFGPFAVTLITSMLGVLEHRPARMMVCDFLSANGRDAIDLIGGFVHDKRWYVVRNVAKILGDIASERAVGFLKKSAHHADPRVRIETLRALTRIPGPTVRPLLVNFLKDTEREVRLRALRAVGQVGCEAAAPALVKKIDDPSVTALDEDELRELFNAYARIAGRDAVTRLTRLARKSPWFGRKRWLPVRLAAVHSLAFCAAPEARAELATLARAGNTQIAQAAQDAARRQKPDTSEGDDESA